MKKHFRKLASVMLALSMIVTMLPIYGTNNNVSAATHTLQNPTKNSRGDTVWDCIWFGSYPQAEVIPSGTYTALDSSLLQNGDTVVSDSIYNQLRNASGWDSNGDITISGNQYRRIKRSDATYTSSSSYCYNWSDSTTYHYFKYEPIKWRVLNVNGTDAFLLADKGLDDQLYNTEFTNITWETSTIRSWLNGYGASGNVYGTDYSSKNFIGTALSNSEQSAIKTTSVINNDNINYGTNGGNNTNDKVFLLSESEVYTDSAKPYGFDSDYSKCDEARRSRSSTYAKAMGTLSSTLTDYWGDCVWWLRSPGNDMCCAAFVYGYVGRNGDFVDSSHRAIRPALHLNLSSSNLYSYAGTVCSDGTENVEGGSTPIQPGDDISYSSNYNDDIENWLTSQGTWNSIRYLCKDENFPNSCYVSRNDATFASNVVLVLSDAIYRGADGWKDLFKSSTSKEEAEKIIAALLDSYQSETKALSQAKSANKYAKIFVDGLENYIKVSAADYALSSEEIQNLENIVTEKKVAELFEQDKYKTLSAYVQIKGGYSENSNVVKCLNDFQSSKTLADQLSKGLSFLGSGLKIISMTEDTINYLFQLESLVEADEMYSEMLLYIRENCVYGVARDAAAELYDVIHGSYMEQLKYVTTSLQNEVVEKALDVVIDGVVDKIPYAKIIKAGFDWGVDISNALFRIDDVQKLKDSMRTVAYVGNCIDDWMLDNYMKFQQVTGTAKNEYAKKTAYAFYMLVQTRKAGEETLQSMMKKNQTTRSAYYTASLETISTLESIKQCMKASGVLPQMLSTTISCPVDVKVFDGENQCVLTVEDGKEYSGNEGGIYFYEYYHPLDNDYVKVVQLPEDKGYSIQCVATGEGIVDTMVSNIDSEGNKNEIHAENIVVNNKDTVKLDAVSIDMKECYVTDDTNQKNVSYPFASTADEYISVEDLNLSKEDCTLKVGEQIHIVGTISPSNATEKQIVWSSQNENVAKVNSDGVITTYAVGETFIIAKSVDNESIQKQIKISVVEENVSETDTSEPGNGEQITAENEVESTTSNMEQITSNNETVTTDNIDTTIETNTNKVATTTNTPTTSKTKKVTKPSKVKKLKVYTKKRKVAKVKLTFKKIKGVKEYKVVVLYKKSVKKHKRTLLTKTIKTNRYTIASRKLKNKNYLYVKIRAYIKHNGKIVYGKWSNIKRVNIKK